MYVPEPTGDSITPLLVRAIDSVGGILGTKISFSTTLFRRSRQLNLNSVGLSGILTTGALAGVFAGGISNGVVGMFVPVEVLLNRQLCSVPVEGTVFQLRIVWKFGTEALFGIASK